MAIPKLNFNTGNVVDPTRGAMQGIAQARGALTDMVNQAYKEEELARQKVLDDRATNIYNQQQQELNDRQKFGKAMLEDTQIRYADANSSGMMSLMKNVELTPEEAALSNKGIETPEVKAKLKAQFELGQNFDNTGVRETEWEKAQRVAKEAGVGGSLGVQERLYGIKAADVAARTKKEADAKAAKDALIKKYEDQSDKLDELLVVKKGRYGSSGTGSNGSSTNKNGTWTAEEAIRLDKLADTFSILGWGGDTKDVNKVTTYARRIGLGPKQTENVIVRMGGGPEKLLGGEKMEIPGKPDATDAEIMAYAKSLLDAEAKKGYSEGTSGGFYDKEDNSAAIKMKKAKLDSLKKQIDAVGGINYDAPEGSPEERSIDKMNSLAKKYWSEIPATGETPKRSGSSSTDTIKKSSLIPGNIGAAMSSSTDGDVARLSLLPKFAKEYENLTKPQQARVDKVLGSDASQKVYGGIQEKLLQRPVYNKETVNTYAKDMQAYGEQQKRLGLAPTGANDSKTEVVTPTIDTKKVPTMQNTIKQIVDKDPTSGLIHKGARSLAGAFGDQSLANRRVGDKAALDIHDTLVKEGVINKGKPGEDRVTVTSDNISSITELYTDGEDRDIDRGLETVVDHLMISLPKDNELRVEYEKAMKDQELASAGAVAISTVLLASGIGREVGAASLRGTARIKKLADTKNLRKWKNEIRAEKRAKDLLHKSLDRNAVLRSRNPGQLSTNPKPLFK